MEILVERKWRKTDYTIGRLYINGEYFSNTLEDTDRNLYSFMSEYHIGTQKIYARTAIPYGTYVVRMDIVSPKYSQIKWYHENCHGGRMPRIMDVKGFSGALIHPGNSAEDSAGCILCGKNTQVGRLTESKATFKKLYDRMWNAYQNGEQITITIRRPV